jgi:ribonuclease D
MKEIQAIDSISPGQAKAYAKSLLERINTGRQLPESSWPENQAGGKLPPEQATRVREIQEKLRASAKINNINPTLLASRKDIEYWVQTDGEIPLMTGWRYELVGKHLLSGG